jgi:prophage regulatory protein
MKPLLVFVPQSQKYESRMFQESIGLQRIYVNWKRKRRLYCSGRLMVFVRSEFIGCEKTNKEFKMETQTTSKLLRRPQVEAKVGLRRSSLYDLLKRGEFPQPIKIGERCIAWLESEIDTWIAQRVLASREK